MIEKVITLDSVEPVEIYGVNDVKLNVIKKYFPKLKIVARGYSIKALGDEAEIAFFEFASFIIPFKKNFLLALVAFDKVTL